MIYVSHQRDPFASIERSLTEWGIGCTTKRLAPEWAEHASRNGVLVTDWDALLADGDHVHYWTRPGFFESAFLNILVSLAASFAIQKLLLPSKKPVDPGDATSPTYAFSGLRANARGDGLAIPVLYGRHRVTAPIINEYIRSGFDTSGNPISEYVVECLISEGPIKSIGDKTADGGPFTREAGNFLQTLQINGQPAENFEGVEAHVRLGNLEQTPIAEVADPVISRDVGLTMEDPVVLTPATTPSDVPSATTAIASAGQFSAGTSNVTKWTDGEETSMVSFIGTDQADEFTAVIEFPQGLVQYSSIGDSLPNSVIYQLRYVQVDDGGTPFGNYIILPARQIQLTRAGLLRIEDKQRTYDPAAYTSPVTGTFVQSRATGQGNPGISCSIDPAKFSAPAPNAVKFSFATWMRRRSAAQATFTTNRLLQWEDTAGNEGFRIQIQRNAGNATVEVHLGTGSSFPSFQLWPDAAPVSGELQSDATKFHHFVITYEANFDSNGKTRIRFYWDGVLRKTVTTTTQVSWDVAQQIRLMSNSETAPTAGYDGHLDETTLWSKTLTPYDVASLYNGGAPIAIDPAAEGLLIGGQWEASDEEGGSPNIGSKSFGPAAFSSAPARTWRYGTGTNAASDPNRATTAGIVKVTPLVNTPKRSKWRVDALRLSAESTSQRNISEFSFSSIQWRTFQDFEYPGMALCAVKVVATDQLSGAPPIVSVIAEGKLVPVWDGVDLISPNMPETYSRSPAWIATDIATNAEYGTGSIYTTQKLDIAQFDALADYAATLIYDNGPRQLLVSARQIDAADTGADPNMAVVAEDCVRYRLDRLPANFPGVTAGKVSTGKMLTCKITGTPSPAVPSWLSDQINAGAQEVIFVVYDSATLDFFVYCKAWTAVATQALYTPGVSGTNFIEVERHDARFRFDGYFDRTDTDAWDAITQVLQTARSVPMRLGSRLSCFTDQPSSPVALIGQGSIIEDTWQQSFEDVRDRPNAESMEFFDEDKNYERDSATDEHPELVDPSKEGGFRWRRVRIEGITRRGAVKRHARRDLNAYFLLRRFVEFELGIDGLAALPGDVIGVSSDTPGYGVSGRIWENASVGTSIKLDRAVTLAPATSYQIQVENVASETRETKPITSGSGTYAAGSAITIGGGGFSFVPDKDDEYALGTVAQGEVKLFRIIESSLNPRELRRRVKCIEYNADVYDDDFGTLPEVVTTTLTAPSAPTVPPGVQNLTASELTVKGPDGSVRIAAQVSFEHFPESYHAVGYTDIYVSVGDHTLGFGGAKLAATLSPADVSLDVAFNFARFQTYTIWVVPKTRDGATAYRSWASFIEFAPKGLASIPSPPANVRASISGEQVTYYWDDPGDGDQSATVEARQGGWLLGRVLFVAPAQARHSPPLSVWDSAPVNANGVAESPIFFRTKLGTGQYSDVATLTFAPSVVSADGNVLERSEEDGPWL